MKKTILITGASSGFGKETALLLARNGYQVFASLRNKDSKNKTFTDELQGIALEESLPLEVIELDVTDTNSIDKAVQHVVSNTGTIDVLINNAGFGGFGWTEGFATEQIRQMFDVNFFGVVDLNKAVLPYMRKKQDGLIIHISSILAKLPTIFMSGYNASKFAIEGYAESLNMESTQFGIQSIIVQPGFFNTGFAKNMFYNTDEIRLSEFGKLVNMPQQMVAGYKEILSMMPPVILVAENLLKLIEAPKSERPLRTVVSADPHGILVHQLNEASVKATQQLNEAMAAFQNQ